MTTSIELEHINKFSNAKVTVNEIRTDKCESQISSENFLESLCPGKRIEKKENLLLTEIKKLSEKVDELSCLREEVSKLKELHDTRTESCASSASSLLR